MKSQVFGLGEVRLNQAVWEHLRAQTWLLVDILAPLAFTRVVLLLIGWFAQYFRQPRGMNRLFFFSPERLLDVWGRWDTEWYMSIIRRGYTIRGDLDQVYSNIAFYPFYPLLVKWFARFFPGWETNKELLLAVGVVISNLMLIGALVVLYKLALHLRNERAFARRLVLYTLIFPGAFVFSAFYTESTFLLLSAGAILAGVKGKWLIAGLLGFLAAMTRPVGILLAAPLGWMYMESIQWQVRQIRPNALWLLLIPAGLLTFLVGITPVTQDLLAPFKVQEAWNREFSWPWETLSRPAMFHRYMTPLDWSFIVVGFVIAVLALVKLPSKAYGIYALLHFVPILTSGTLLSSTRLLAVNFPLLIMLALAGRRRWMDQWIVIGFVAMQTLLMVAWSQGYWAG